MNAAGLSNKLLQMANGAVYGEDKKVLHIHDRKLDALEDLIEAANAKPLLVAYWYKHDLARIRERFDVRTIDTEKDIDDWNAERFLLLPIHPASAGHGLNLQEGGLHRSVVWAYLVIGIIPAAERKTLAARAEKYGGDSAYRHPRHAR